MQATKSLHARNSNLSSPKEQLKILSDVPFADGELPTFQQKLKESGISTLRPNKLEILQVNLGYMCNQACKHCHVDAGPDRKEIMTRETLEVILEVLRTNQIETLDLTGGAPEMNPDFRWFVQQARPLVHELIVRSNLTIITANKKYFDLPEFFASQKVRVVSSLPFYNADKTDRQRGEGVFKKSIEALQKLNELGFGKENSGLLIDLVYNPTGAFLPAAQHSLEQEFKRVLKQEFGIEFNQLFCITNLPISRFLEYLIKTDNFEDYMDKLIEAFNPAAVEGVMCKNTLSVGWNGDLFDCDFNQMLALKVSGNSPKNIKDFNLNLLNYRDIVIHQHCFGCTAGAGSSCQGTLV